MGIETTKNGGNLKSFPDFLFKGEDLVQNDTIVSEAKLVGQTLNSLDIVVETAEDVTIAATGVLTVSLASGAGFATKKVLYTVTAPGGGSAIPAGTVLARYTPNVDDPLTARLEASVTDLAVTGSINAYLTYIAN